MKYNLQGTRPEMSDKSLDKMDASHYRAADSDIKADMQHGRMLDHYRRGHPESEAKHRSHHGKALDEHAHDGMRSDLSRGHVIEHS